MPHVPYPMSHAYTVFFKSIHTWSSTLFTLGHYVNNRTPGTEHLQWGTQLLLYRYVLACYIRPNGNFGGKIFVVPLKQSHAYLTRATLSSIVRICFENKGIMSVSYTLESMILSNFRLLFGSAVEWSYAPAPAFLSRSSPVVWLSQLYWQLQCWKPVPALIVNHRAVVVSTPRAGNTCIVLSFKVDFDLHLRSIAYVTITKKFTENIFTDSCKVVKFVQILFLEKIPLYSSFMVANQLFMQPFPTHNTQT